MIAAGSGKRVIAISELGIILQITQRFHFLDQSNIKFPGQMGNMDGPIDAGMKDAKFRIHQTTTFPN